MLFKVTTAGQFTVLHNLDTWALPNPMIQATDGNFYGTTVQGGASSNCPLYACGTIFKITPDATYSLLYAFDGTNGANPGPLIQGADGNFYGTANAGGTSNNCKSGCGVVYKITPEGSFSVLYNLDLTNGANPSPLIQSADGKFYGTAYAGGTSASCTGGCGAIFTITPDGSYSVVHNFDASGGNPNLLIQDSIGNFYGTTNSGGTGQNSGCNPGGCGVLYSLVVNDFSLAASAFGPSSVSAGASSTSKVSVTTVGAFTGAVALSCSVQPAPPFAPKCSVSPSSAIPGSGVTLTVNTTGPTARSLPFSNDSRPLFATWLALVGLVVVGLRCGSDLARKQKLSVAALAGVLSLSFIFQVACGSGGNTSGGSGGGGSTPVGAYTITVTGASSFLQHSTTAMVTVQ